MSSGSSEFITGWHEDGTEPTAPRPRRENTTTVTGLRSFPVFHGVWVFGVWSPRSFLPVRFWESRLVSINDFSFWLNKVGPT